MSPKLPYGDAERRDKALQRQDGELRCQLNHIKNFRVGGWEMQGTVPVELRPVPDELTNRFAQFDWRPLHTPPGRRIQAGGQSSELGEDFRGESLLHVALLFDRVLTSDDDLEGDISLLDDELRVIAHAGVEGVVPNAADGRHGDATLFAVVIWRVGDGLQHGLRVLP